MSVLLRALASVTLTAALFGGMYSLIASTPAEIRQSRAPQPLPLPATSIAVETCDCPPAS